jgi:hypothetical protein
MELVRITYKGRKISIHRDKVCHCGMQIAFEIPQVSCSLEDAEDFFEILWTNAMTVARLPPDSSEFTLKLCYTKSIYPELIIPCQSSKTLSSNSN